MTDLISDEELDELERLERQATLGEWGVGFWGSNLGSQERVFKSDSEKHMLASTSAEDHDVAGNYDWEEGGIIEAHDADFIVAARNALPRLLSSYRAVKAWNASLREDLNEAYEVSGGLAIELDCLRNLCVALESELASKSEEKSGAFFVGDIVRFKIDGDSRKGQIGKIVSGWYEPDIGGFQFRITRDDGSFAYWCAYQIEYVADSKIHPNGVPAQ